MKILLLTILVLAGCATQPASQPFDRSDMNNFKMDCGRARQQVDYLQSRITAFHDHFKNSPTTLEDRRYYTKLKNSLWSLRSSCSALQR